MEFQDQPTLFAKCHENLLREVYTERNCTSKHFLEEMPEIQWSNYASLQIRFMNLLSICLV